MESSELTTNLNLTGSNAVIFDMDGTILDSMTYWADTAEKYLLKLGIEPEANLSRKIANKSLKHGAEYLRRKYGLKKSDLEIIKGIKEVIAQAYRYEIQAKDGAENFLKELKKRGIKTALATATDRIIFDSAMKRLNLEQYFDFILTCSEYNTSKTEPLIYLKAAEKLNCPIENTWVFEDALYALKTATSAGFKTACIYDSCAEESVEELKAFSNLYFENYDRVSAYFFGGVDSFLSLQK